MKSKEEIIIEIVSNLSGCEKEALFNERTFRGKGINSLMMVQIIVNIEQALGFEVDDTIVDISKISSVDDLIVIANSAD